MSKINNKKDALVKFIADSDATEHLRKTKLIFKMLDTDKFNEIKCANKESKLTTHGIGDVEIKTDSGERLTLTDVLYSGFIGKSVIIKTV